MDFFQEIIKILKTKNLDKQELNNLKNQLSKKYKLKRIPTDAEILLNASERDYKFLTLMTKPVRTLSGVAPIALMCKPHKCPHGTCIYCPGGPGSIFGEVPQSYTGFEPSTMRSARNKYDPYYVIFNRLEQYVVLNQNPEKTEIIIQGGTFLSLNESYKKEFVMYIFKALNDFSTMFYNGTIKYAKFKKFFELPGDINKKDRIKRIHNKLDKLKKFSTPEQEQIKNEHAKIRCVGLTIETKPDYGLLKHGNEMLGYGCTRVELGVQTTNDRTLRYINRGHTLDQTIESTRVLKDLGFKINYHMMPGLPLSTPERDVKMLIETIENPDFRPDMYKIYPTMVLQGTGLHILMQKGKYLPLDTMVAAAIIKKFKAKVPRWVRIMRVQRDIPTKNTEAGVDKTNLRQYLNKCQCIRCREAGLKNKKFEMPVMFIEEYIASEGKEFFISYEDKNRNHIYGYARLRFPSQNLRPEITKNSALLRELHVVGSAVGLGEEGKLQHKGLGKNLLKKAEQISAQYGNNKIVVISGVGAREYYRRFGYERQGPYMTKIISNK